MKALDFDDIFMNLATDISQKSHCVKKKVGAVIAKNSRVISLGYNGPPSNTYNCDEKWPDKGCKRSIKGGCYYAIHAEQNAILYATKNNSELEGTTLYVTLSPCLACAKVIFSIGIKKIFYKDLYSKYKGIATEEGLEFLKQFNIDCIQYKSYSSIKNKLK